MYCQLVIYHCLQGVMDAEAKQLLASNVTVLSNGFVSTSVFPKTCDARSPQQCQAIMTSCVGLLLIANSKDNKVTVYNNNLFFPSIALSNSIKRIVLLLTTN
jgi:hypothetical protein